jgi:hypothetical protein
MAQNPSVPRYFLSDVSNEITELARLIDKEQAALVNGVPDALKRLKRLSDQCDEIDPFYRVELVTDSGAGTVTARLIPRYQGAERDRPITLRATFAFPDRDSAKLTWDRFQAAHDFGIGFDVPSEYVHQIVFDAPAGPGQFGSGVLQIGSRELEDVPDFELRLRITAPDGSHIVSLPIAGTARTGGAVGIVADLCDSSGMLNAEVHFNWVEGTLRGSYRFESRPCFPAPMLPVLRFMVAFNAPNAVTFCQADGTPMGPPVPLTTDRGRVFEQSVRLVQLLARVQDATGVWFDVPSELTNGDLEDLAIADQLLKGEIVRGTWQSFEAEVDGDTGRHFLGEFTRQDVEPGSAMSFWQKAEEALDLAGHIMPLG